MTAPQTSERVETGTHNARFLPILTFRGDDLLLGAETRIGSATRALFLGLQDREALDEDRVAALLASAYGHAIEPSQMRYVRTALRKHSDGETALALVNLALANFKRLDDVDDSAWRLGAAERLLAAGMSPGELLTAIGLASSGETDIDRAYNPEQPRVPAGNGRESGRWGAGHDDQIIGSPAVTSHPSGGVHIADNSDNWAPIGRELVDSSLDIAPGRAHAKLAAQALNQGNYTRSAIYEAMAFLDAAVAILTLGASEELTTAARKAAQLAANAEIGKAAEAALEAKLAKSGVEVGSQITLETKSGVRVRPDFLTRDPETGAIGCIECKASDSAGLTINQRTGYPEIRTSGATVVGAGKPGFPGGTRLPPTDVEIVRNPKE